MIFIFLHKITFRLFKILKKCIPSGRLKYRFKVIDRNNTNFSFMILRKYSKTQLTFLQNCMILYIKNLTRPALRALTVPDQLELNIAQENNACQQPVHAFDFLFSKALVEHALLEVVELLIPLACLVVGQALGHARDAVRLDAA